MFLNVSKSHILGISTRRVDRDYDAEYDAECDRDHDAEYDAECDRDHDDSFCFYDLPLLLIYLQKNKI
jgi:hypothetical protein